ncbi:hypothetical protein K431DRAFT_348099 [Polychaeton citri CBS 116435]|uniref:MYND-type domain-containing protein n=1 Tax=Polychaeton citri CBS 116435 TaxID=1314669 RepID=A0A9P4UNT6_9PEZI|nr:hypothetical protein K431DRAFT_348099 [Polychaeton citri CBS 116435]
MPPKACPICAEPAPLSCQNCRQIPYCSQECQEADWSAHKLACCAARKMPKAPDNLRSIARLAVYFHHEEDINPWFGLIHKGVFVDGKLSREQENKIAREEGHFEEKSFTPGIDDNFGSVDANKNAWTGEDLGYIIRIFYREDAIDSWPLTNETILNVTRQRSARPWGGPLLAVCFDKTGKEVLDMDVQKFSELAAFLIDFNNHEPEQQLRKQGKRLVVKVACDAEAKTNTTYRQDRFQQLRLPSCHIAFDCVPSGFHFGIAKLVGLHIDAYHLPIHSSWKVGDLRNKNVMPMLIGVDPDSSGGETSHPGEQMAGSWLDYQLFHDGQLVGTATGPAFGTSNLSRLGSLILFHPDGSPLRKETAELFSRFCLSVQLSFLRARGDNTAMAVAVAAVTPEAWLRWEAAGSTSAEELKD